MMQASAIVYKVQRLHDISQKKRCLKSGCSCFNYMPIHITPLFLGNDDRNCSGADVSLHDTEREPLFIIISVFFDRNELITSRHDSAGKN